jgi:hypothetical protein
MSSDLLPYIELGNPCGIPIVFLSGFPDDERGTFAPLINHMNEYRIISCCFPDNQLVGKEVIKAKPWGMN